MRAPTTNCQPAVPAQDSGAHDVGFERTAMRPALHDDTGAVVPTLPIGRAQQSPTSVLTLADIGFDRPAWLLASYGLALARVADGAPIPGSYWGEPEAGVIGETVHARADTPLHSLLHEACHLIVADPQRRAAIHTDASDSQAEEDACCLLQIVLGDALPGVGSPRIMEDMDRWGYTFRLGSARAWYERDADDARAWLAARGLPTTAAAALAPRPATE